MSSNAVKVWDKIISLILVLIGFAYLGIYHPTDGSETVAVVIIIIGGLNLTTVMGQQMLEKALGVSGGLGNSPAPSQSSSSSSGENSGYHLPPKS